MMLKNYIIKNYPKIEHSDILVLIAKGKVLINNKRETNPKYIVKDTDVVSLFISKKKFKIYETANISPYGINQNSGKVNSDLESKGQSKRLRSINKPSRPVSVESNRDLVWNKRGKEIKEKREKLSWMKKRLSSLSKAEPISINTKNIDTSSNSNSKKIEARKKLYMESLKRKRKSPSKSMSEHTLPSFDYIVKTRRKQRKVSLKPLPKSRILFDAKGIIAINKNHHETLDEEHNRVDKKLSLYLQQKGEDVSRLRYHNKLDSETKGIIIFTKTKKAEQSMKEIVARRELESIYYAVCIPAPFLIEKKTKHFNLPLPFTVDENGELVQVPETKKDDLRRIRVDKVGQIRVGGITYPILRIITNKLREASIRFLLTYYGMTIINDLKTGYFKQSDDLILFHSRVKFSKEADSIFRGITIELSKEHIIKRMKIILNKTVKSANE